MITPDDVSYALQNLKAKQPKYRLYRDYLNGDQRLAFATDSFRNAFGYLFKEFAYNRTTAVIDAVADRLTIDSWQTEGKEDDAILPIEQAAIDLWKRNRMPRRQGEVHTEALCCGDAYLIVWPDQDTGLAKFSPNAGCMLHAVYEDEYGESIAYAVKMWQEDRGTNAGRWRVTIYEPDQIRRYISKSKTREMPEKLSALMEYTDDGQPVADNPYGQVPVFHFANNAMTGHDGHSELSDIVPLQDALNKAVMDMLIAGEFLGFPQRIIAGLEPTMNTLTGKAEAPFNVAKDRIIMLGDAAAKWGQFDPADMAQFTNVQNEFDMKIARVSRVPVHWLNQTGDFPSGEALKTAEGPFVSKVKDRQTAFGDVWADAMQFALMIEGKGGEDVTAGVQPVWMSAETRSEMDKLNAAALRKAVGVPDEQIWAELGYSPDEIATFQAAKAKAQQEQMAQFTTAFDRGQAPIGGA